MSDAQTLAENSIDQFENYTLYSTGGNNGFYADDSSSGIKINIGYGFNLTDNISGTGTAVRNQLAAAGITFTNVQWRLVVQYATNPTSASATTLNKRVGVTVTQEQAATLVGNRLTGVVTSLTKHIPNFADLPALTQAALENIGYDSFALLGPSTYGAATKADLVGVADQLAFNADHDATDLSNNKGLELRFLFDGLMALGVDATLNGSHSISTISTTGATTADMTNFLTGILTGNTKIGSQTAAEYVASWKSSTDTQDYQTLATMLDQDLVARGAYVATNNTVASKKNPNEQTAALTKAINGYDIAIPTTSFKLIAPGSYTGTISGFTQGHTLDLVSVGTATKATLGTDNVLTVSGTTGGPIKLKLSPTTNYATDTFQVASDGNGGTNVTIVPIPNTGRQLPPMSSLNNPSPQQIVGLQYGVWVPEGSAAISNKGTIAGVQGVGVDIQGNGTLTNTGLIWGYVGVLIGLVGKVLNSGTIEGLQGVALQLGDGGTVTNGGGGSIDGTSAGVVITSAIGTILNSGRIIASAAAGIAAELGSGGTLNNETASSLIQGGEYGFWSPDGSANVSNLGTLVGTNGDGIAIGDNGTITNQGSIGGASGIDVSGAGRVTNAATIAATNGDGVLIGGGGNVTNDVAQSITGTSGGVIITSVTGTISNSGTIVASAAAGIGSELGSGGSLTNASDATIQGGENGFWSPDGSATVKNSGTLVGSNGDGIAIGAGGSVGNQGYVGGASGIDIAGSGTLTNAGTITATNGEAVLIGGGGSVTNDVGQSITGTSGGVIITSATGTIRNSGSMVAGAAAGIGSELGSGGTLTNASSATIQGGEYGFWSPNGSANVSNSGTLVGTHGDGIAIGGNGTVTNHGSIGGASGIDISGFGSLTNASAITATNGDAVLIGNGGNVTNDAAKSITGTSGGVIITSATGTIGNSGRIVASAAAGVGSELGSGGSLDNATASSLIQGGEYGFWSPDGSANVSNLGTLVGTNGDGIAIGANGTVTNQGSIGGASGIDISGFGSLSNEATIAATNGDGVLIGDGGNVTNDVAQSITGTSGGVIVTSVSGTIGNSGSIVASAAAGIGSELGSGGTLTNAASATIQGGEYGFWSPDGSATVSNLGTLIGSNGDGIAIGAKATITNQGYVGGASGIDVSGAGTLTNSGTITATNGDGVLIGGGGSVTNDAGQSITGTSGGVIITGSDGTISNSGTIIASAAAGIGAELGDGGSLDATGSSLIQGGEYGVWAPDGTANVTVAGTVEGSIGVAMGGSGSTLTVNGTVIGTGGTAIDLATGDHLVLGSGATIVGKVIDPLQSDTLVLPAGSTGSLAGALVGFGALDVGAGADWTLAGPAGVATVANDGTLTLASGGSLDVTGAQGFFGTGVVQLDANSVLDLAGVGNGGRVAFLGGGELVLGAASASGPLITGFGAGDAIDLRDVVPGALQLNYAAGTGVLQIEQAGTMVAGLSFAANSLGSGAFQIVSDHHDGTLLTHG